eukprot:215959-Amphidinium_carterae.1
MSAGSSAKWVLPSGFTERSGGEAGQAHNNGGNSSPAWLRPTLGSDALQSGNSASAHNASATDVGGELNTRLPVVCTSEAQPWWQPLSKDSSSAKSYSILVDNFISWNPGLDASAIATLRAAPPVVQEEAIKTDFDCAKN